jgi:hypothetical protein
MQVTVTRAAEGSSRELLEMKMPTMVQVKKVARALPDDERVPYAFEKRVMAHLWNARPADIWNACAGLMWRAAVSCLLISLITGAAVSFADPSTNELFATDLERTVLAPIDVDDSW